MTLAILLVVAAVLGGLIGRRLAQLERDQVKEVNRLERLRQLTRPDQDGKGTP
jgi:hypothetical protein